MYTSATEARPVCTETKKKGTNLRFPHSSEQLGLLFWVRNDHGTSLYRVHCDNSLTRYVRLVVYDAARNRAILRGNLVDSSGRPCGIVALISREILMLTGTRPWQYKKCILGWLVNQHLTGLRNGIVLDGLGNDCAITRYSNISG